MREIKAIIRPERLSVVVAALHERPNLPGVTISMVDGIGRTPGNADSIEFGEVQMAKLETVVSSDLVDWVVATIQRAGFTGRSGDGRSSLSLSNRQCRSGRATKVRKSCSRRYAER